MSVLKQVLVCLVLLAGAGAAWFVYEDPQMVGLAKPSDAPAERSGGRRGGIPGVAGPGGDINVITAVVQTDAGGDSAMALGTAKAVRSVTLFPEVTGVVEQILFSSGQMVEAGTVLVRLRSDEQRIAVDRAKVALEQARSALQRSEALAASKTIAAVALSDAETAVQLAEIEVRSAEIALERRSITAPFAGVTGLTDLSVGDLVTSTTALTTLDDLATLRVAFEIPERWASRISPGQPISASAQGMPGSAFAGRVVAIDSRIDETTRTLKLEAELDNQGGVLKTGMAMTVRLEFQTDEQLAVPTLSVQWDRKGSFVWKIAGGSAQRAEVAIIRRQSGIVLVQGGIQPGDHVVVEGIQRLRPGAKVAEIGVEQTAADAPGSQVAPVEDGPAADRPVAGPAAPAGVAPPALGSAEARPQARS